MAFTMIKGTFHVVGYSPDGDSVRFKARRTAHWNLLDGPRARRNQRDHVQLRFEAIDALETHYKGHSQPLEFAHPATDYLLQQAGIRNVVWGPTRRRVTSADDGTDGYILSRTTEMYGRPVAFVFAGPAPEADGSQIHLTVPRLRQSLNYKLAKAGWVYPTYYSGLFSDLRDAITGAVVEAWNAGRGLWPYDHSNVGFRVAGFESIEERFVIMPKLFRRLIQHLEATNGRVSGFKDFLEDRREAVEIIPLAHDTHFDNVVSQSGNQIRLDWYPEELKFRG